MSCGCLEGVLIVFEGCLDCVCKVSWRFPEGIWKASGGVMEHLLKVFGACWVWCGCQEAMKSGKCQTFLGKNFLGPKIFFDLNFLGPQIFWTLENLGPIWDLISFWSKNNYPKIFWLQIFIQHFYRPKIFFPKNLFLEIFWTQNILDKILLHPHFFLPKTSLCVVSHPSPQFVCLCHQWIYIGF